MLKHMLSVIICTYNREQYILPLLESISKNIYPTDKYEIIVVDNNCTDGTREVCKQFADNHPEINFKYIVESEQGLSAARNCGIRESQGNIILYVDDDASVDSNYLADYANWFENHPETMAAGGPIHPFYEQGEEPSWMSPYTRALLTAWMDYGSKVRSYPKGRYPGGGNAAYRRKVFELVGPFNTSLGRKGGNLMGSEEKDIFDKMTERGMEILYLPTPILHHSIPPTKLGNEYFVRLTTQMGKSERERTMAIGTTKYLKRLFLEMIKWGGTIVLLIGYTITCSPSKGWKLVQFRSNVTKGLLGRIK